MSSEEMKRQEQEIIDSEEEYLKVFDSFEPGVTAMAIISPRRNWIYIRRLISEILCEPVRLIESYDNVDYANNRMHSHFVVETLDHLVLLININMGGGKYEVIDDIHHKDVKIDEDVIEAFIQINLNYDVDKDYLKEINYFYNEKEDRIVIDINLDKYKEKYYKKNIYGNKRNIYLVMITANDEELEMLARQDKLIRVLRADIQTAAEKNEEDEEIA